jgi:glutamate synthase domain-containing protein 2/glutamate synthase domain-containing protein 1/glutamate synthase domain-containing protein 3
MGTIPPPASAVFAATNTVSHSLVDPAFHRDSCGVGFVAQLSGQATHQVLQHALTALSRLAHRGAVASDGRSSDGVGVLTQIPRAWLLQSAGLSLAPDQLAGVGVLFLPQEGEAVATRLFEQSLIAHGLELLAWRPVPIREEQLGEQALASAPRIVQALIASPRIEDVERRLFLARKQFEREATGAHVCSLSASTMVYKALCTGALLSSFYPDLQQPEFTTAYAIFHQRYATNAAPAWRRAQPLRTLAHNGEINTIWGNRARMDARAATIAPECYPLISPDGSDSTSLDETVELLARNGRNLSQAVRMLLPPAQAFSDSGFMRYHADCVEPWDGPAAIAFADGLFVGAALDRNGLRPCRFFVTVDGLVIAGSEAGLIDLDPQQIRESGRLGPGEMLLVDLEQHTLLDSEALLARFDRDIAYDTLVADVRLEPSPTDDAAFSTDEIHGLHRAFGYSREDVTLVLKPMATEGKEAVWSMGDDTPIAPLARAPRSVYAFLRQRFAQVTNPPIDALRESCVVQLHTRLGPWPHLLNPHARIPGLSLPSPFLSLAQMHALRAGQHPLAADLPLAVLDCLLRKEESLSSGLQRLCAEAVALVKGGARLLLLTDRGITGQRVADQEQRVADSRVGTDKLPVPMALATGAVHHALVEASIRTAVGLAVEAGDCRDVHHAAVLIGYGAGAVCPWLALVTARDMQPETGEQNMLHAFDEGLAKIMSKMGISVVDSYRSAHLFDSIGLHAEVIERCFRGTPAPLSGIGFAEIEEALRQSWNGGPGMGGSSPHAAGGNGESVPVPLGVKVELPDHGWVRYRKAERAELHAWQPQRVREVQSSVGSARGNLAVLQQPQSAVATLEGSPQHHTPPAEITTLRDLLSAQAAGPPLPLELVEGGPSLVRRFVASAMSLGSLSPEAHGTITEAMNLLGARSNTGEGGEDPSVYSTVIDGERHFVRSPRDNKIKQFASGRFGVTAEYLAHAEEIEIKIAQGSKPGEGGQLPAHKVTELIARLRHAQPGMTLISPPPHHDIYSIEDLAQLIYDLKRVNPRAAIGVKLVSSCGVGTIAAGVAKAYADYIVIAGHSGGTGASPLSSIKHAGNPWELGLAEAQQCLIADGLRDRVRLRCDGGLQTARDVLIAALLGADEFAFGTAVLVALGCDMARQCHLNTCPTGIATQRPELRAKFRGKPEHIVRFFEALAFDLQCALAELGIARLEDAIGRTDLLQQTRQQSGLDLTRMLHFAENGARHWAGGRNARPETEAPLDDAWQQPALKAARSGMPFTLQSEVANQDRTLGARLAGALAEERLDKAEPAPSIRVELHGVAGQSLGAFAVRGMHLMLNGFANDFVGKSLSGGEIVLRAEGTAADDSAHHVLLGNVALYGATSGRLLAAGRAGERFAVRNSGATAVVEGVGDHGCEYMTGGEVVVLGRAGHNFGAGMTGGLAWVLDEDGSFLRDSRYHAGFLLPQRAIDVAAEEQERLRSLLTQHVGETRSQRGTRMLGQWEATLERLVRLAPLAASA